jgi:hypothetical protein
MIFFPIERREAFSFFLSHNYIGKEKSFIGMIFFPIERREAFSFFSLSQLYRKRKIIYRYDFLSY